jgi:hypothetical protein
MKMYKKPLDELSYPMNHSAKSASVERLIDSDSPFSSAERLVTGHSSSDLLEGFSMIRLTSADKLNYQPSIPPTPQPPPLLSQPIKSPDRKDRISDTEIELMDGVFKAFSSLSEIRDPKRTSLEVLPRKSTSYESLPSPSSDSRSSSSEKLRPSSKNNSGERLKDLSVVNSEGSPERLMELRSLPDNPQWEDNYARLLEYHKVYGHIKVQKRLDLKLAQWVVNQRASYRNGQLSATRIAKLEALGIDWDPRNLNKEPISKSPPSKEPPKLISTGISSLEKKDLTLDEAFQKNVEVLLAFKKKYGHFDIPKNSVYSNLFYWAFNQRGMYRKGILSEERIRQLDAIGFPWQTPVAAEPAVTQIQENVEIEGEFASSLENILRASDEAFEQESTNLRRRL